MQHPARLRRRSWAVRTPSVSAAALILAGCAPDWTYAPPALDLAAVYAAAPHALSQGPGRWEIGFDDPVLAELIAAALADSPSFATARARLAAAEAEARAAGAPFAADGSADVTLGDTERADLGLAARLAPGLAAGRVAAGARADAARFGAEEARRALLQDLVTAYIDLRYFQQLMHYRQADAASRGRTLQDIRIRVNAGAATEVDVLSARALLAEAKGRLPETEADAMRQQNRLSTLVGRPVGRLGVDLGFPGRQPAPQRNAALGVPADLLRARPDVRQAERLYAAASADIAAARAALYPSLSLSGLIQVPLSGGANLSTLGAGVSVPVFSRPALQDGVTAAEARAVAAYEDWRATVLLAVEEVETALAARAAAEQAAATAAEVVDLQVRALNLSRRLVREGGEITALEVLDRERRVSDARATLAERRRAVALAHIQLRAALGLDRITAETPLGG